MFSPSNQNGRKAFTCQRIRYAVLVLASVCTVFVLAAILQAATPQEEQQEKLEPFTVRVVDQNGRVVAGADVGQGAGRATQRGPAWEFLGVRGPSRFVSAVTDSNGQTRMFADDIVRPNVVIIARHAARKLVGIKKVSREELVSAGRKKSPVEIRLEPECRVYGRLESSELRELNLTFDYINVNVRLDGIWVYSWTSPKPNYQFFLPPGTYTLHAKAEYCHFVRTSVTVQPSKTELKLEPVDLLAGATAKLVGQPAQEIPEVFAWKNSEPLRIRDLRGKYVLLYFWGYWCGPCLGHMPYLIELHDKYAKRGLVIIGVHVGAKVDDSINTPEKLDAELASVRESLWKGRDIPFTVAMVSARVRENPGQKGEVRSRAANDYGVVEYPTTILIDTEGKVVGHFHEDTHVKLFEALPAVQ